MHAGARGRDAKVAVTLALPFQRLQLSTRGGELTIGEQRFTIRKAQRRIIRILHDRQRAKDLAGPGVDRDALGIDPGFSFAWLRLAAAASGSGLK